MKKTALACVLALLLVACPRKKESAPGGTSPGSSSGRVAPAVSAERLQKFYQFKSAVVKYGVKSQGDTRSSMVTYIDDYGARYATEASSEVEAQGKKMTRHSSMLLTPEAIYTVDVDQRRAVRWPPLLAPDKLRALFDSVLKTVPREKQTKAQALGRFALETMDRIAKMRTSFQDWKSVGEETFLDRPCTVYDATASQGATPLPPADERVYIVVWKNLILKTRTARGEVLLDAQSLQVDVPIPPGKFQVPTDVAILDWKDFVTRIP